MPKTKTSKTKKKPKLEPTGFILGVSIEHPAWMGKPHINLERAIWDTEWLWSHNIYCATSIPDEHSRLPDWWEQYIEALS